MPDRLTEIKERWGAQALVTTCHKEGCRIPMRALDSPSVLYNLDKQGSPLDPDTETRCDYIFFTEHDSTIDVLALELKKGGGRPNEVQRQIQAGASVAEKLFSRGEAVRFTPVLVHGGHTRKASWERTRVRFLDARPTIYRRDCGTPMSDILAGARKRPAPR